MSGKAHGKNRRYQETCRDILMHRDPTLKPWSGDGIDIAFDLPDTTWTIDVALCDGAGRLIVVECRRTADAVKQEDVAAFAYKIEQLRRTQGAEVAGLFVAKTKHQIGAVKVGQYNSIDVVVLGEDAEPLSFDITFFRYDAERERVLRNTFLGVRSETMKIKDELFAVLVSGDGKS